MALAIFEDEDLLVVNKPAGLNTHSPSPYAGEGLYDWLRHREARWADLAIIHRLDKETSGVIVFSKSVRANRSLARQFTEHLVRKRYLLLTDRRVSRQEFTVKTSLIRSGDRYISRSGGTGGQPSETHFRLLSRCAPKPLKPSGEASRSSEHSTLIEAEPRTGRTHQIRVHAAESGFPVLGDTLYGGTPAPRVCLHAAEIHLEHPASGREQTFRSTADFQTDSRRALREAVIDPHTTTAWRVIHGASDSRPGWYVDLLGDYLLSQSDRPLTTSQQEELARLLESFSCRGAYHKLLTRRTRQIKAAKASPRLVLGEAAPDRFTIRENGLEFELSFNEGYSVGLFLDQRENRRRLLTGHVAAGFPLSTVPGTAPTVLNTFAYTCGFSVAAAKAVAHTTSLDLSKKYLEWGRRNFALNQLDPARHEFICGDVFDWLRRLARKRRLFDVILLDPPTFSQSKEHGIFRAEKDYGSLVTAALPLLRRGGVLFASTNTAQWPPGAFLESIHKAIQDAGRRVALEHYVPQPVDFPISRFEPGYLKGVWMTLAP